MQESSMTTQLSAEQMLLMVAQFSHDIRSPLSALSAVAEFCAAQLPEEAKSLLKMAIHRINTMANDFLSAQRSVFKLDSFYTKPASQPKTIANLMSEIISEKNLLYGKSHSVKILAQLSDAEHSLTEAHGSYIQRMFSNLLNNSIESLNEKEGQIEITTESLQSFTIIKILDNGKGIPKSVLSNIGKRGFSYGKKDGNGLGLSHALDFMESIGGHLEIKSTEGHGTTINLYFPAVLK
jgi:signal transduction histidine kinase